MPAWSKLNYGQALSCSANDLPSTTNGVYRYMGNSTANWYPNPTVAGSMDPNWSRGINLDCQGLTAGPSVLHGNENDTATFTCPSGKSLTTGTVIYGTQPNHIVTYSIPAGTTSMAINSTTMGQDPNVGVGKTWGASYTCG
jgi:hypothetical protein